MNDYLRQYYSQVILCTLMNGNIDYIDYKLNFQMNERTNLPRCYNINHNLYLLSVSREINIRSE